MVQRGTAGHVTQASAAGPNEAPVLQQPPPIRRQMEDEEERMLNQDLFIYFILQFATHIM